MPNKDVKKPLLSDNKSSVPLADISPPNNIEMNETELTSTRIEEKKSALIKEDAQRSNTFFGAIKDYTDNLGKVNENYLEQILQHLEGPKPGHNLR